MEVQNGITIFQDGDQLPPLPEGLTDLHFSSLLSPYGFRIVEVNGKPYWVPGTEQDYRESEAKRLNIPPDAVIAKTLSGLYCGSDGTRNCLGACGIRNHRCTLTHNIEKDYYYCMCINEN